MFLRGIVSISSWYYFKPLLSVGFHCVEALAAINRFTLARLERHFTVLAAPGASSSEHLSRSGVSSIGSTALRFSVLAAGKASFRLIGIALGSEEFLLSWGECEWVPAVYACDLFVLIGHLVKSSINNICGLSLKLRPLAFIVHQTFITYNPFYKHML